MRPGYIVQVNTRQTRQIAEDLESLLFSYNDFNRQLTCRIGRLAAAFKDLVIKRIVIGPEETFLRLHGASNLRIGCNGRKRGLSTPQT